MHRGTLAHGIDSGTWVAWGEPGDHAPDQQAEDGRSLCFTSAPLSEPLELLGFPEVSLTIISDRPLALLAVRLCDVAPTGASALVTRGRAQPDASPRGTRTLSRSFPASRRP